MRSLCSETPSWDVYIVAAESQHENLTHLLRQIVNHEFSQNLKLRIVTFEQFEHTECFGHAQKKLTIRDEYQGAKKGEVHGPYALTEPEETEQAIIIPAGDTCELLDLLHELGHISATRTSRGKELRRLYESERAGLDEIIGAQYSRSLAERSIFLPEDYEIERSIVHSLDNSQARKHLEHACDVYGTSLQMIRGSDTSPEGWRRAQTALHSLEYSLASRFFAKIAQERSFADLVERFLELSEKFASTHLLSSVSIERLFDLMTRESLKEWVEECSSTLKRIVLFARQQNP